MLRSIYNRGVELGSAPYVHGLFRDVYTGVDIQLYPTVIDLSLIHI